MGPVAAAPHPGHQVPGPVEGVPRHPFGLDAQGVQLLHVQPPHLPDAVEVHGARVDVHRPLQQIDGLVGPGLHLGHDAGLGVGEGVLGGEGGERRSQAPGGEGSEEDMADGGGLALLHGRDGWWMGEPGEEGR